MLYHGRPELPLPPAPDTPVLLLSRTLLAATGSALFTFTAGTLGLSAMTPDSLMAYLPAALFGLYLWSAGFGVWLSLRLHHERRYWTAARVQRLCPAIWCLYCAGNGSLASSRLPAREIVL